MKTRPLVLWTIALVLSIFLTKSSNAATPYDIGSPTLTQLYVSNTGNDNNTGLTQAQSLQTIRGAWSKIQSTGFASTGFKVNFLPGSYNSDTYLQDVHGSYQKPVIFTAANGPGTVNFNGNIQFYQSSYIYLTDIAIKNGGDVLHFDTCDHILLRNIVADGGNRQAHETIKMNQSQYIYIEGSDIHGAYDNPIDFVAVQYGHIINNKVHDGEDWCAYAKGGSAYFIVEGNEFYNCGTGGYTVGQGTGFEYMTPPWITYEGTDIKVINNYIHDVDGAALGIQGCDSCLVAHNTAINTGRRSHLLGILFGNQECDGDTNLPGVCQSNYQLGGWGDASGRVFNIPNRNTYVYNNIFYNHSGYQSQWQHLEVSGPQTNSGGNLPAIVYADTNLQIRGNIFVNGGSNMPIGVGGEACTPSNPTCNEAQLLADNDFNTFQPQFVNVAAGDFRPLPNGNLFSNPGYDIPDFSASDLPPLNAPLGNINNDVRFDRDGNARTSTIIPGAYAGSGSGGSTSADVSVSIADSSDPIVAGNVLTYTVSVSNAGPASAESLIVSGNLTGATVNSASSSRANCAINSNGYTCNFGSFAPGTASILVMSQTSGAGNLDFTANATSSTSDSNNANNSDAERTTVSGDSDGDGVLDASDNCPTLSNANQADNDADRIGDLCDTDDDNDGIADASDNCPLASNANQADINGNGVGDACDNDMDGDGRPNTSDNCPLIANSDQANTDSDSVGNVCDNCPTVANSNQADANGNGIGDACEVKLADLTGTWVVPASQSCTGSGTQLSCTVKGTANMQNIGNKGSAVASVVNFYLSSDVNQDSSDLLLKSASTSSLGMNKNRNIGVAKTLARGQTGAGKYIIVTFDSTNVVNESNESNNKIASNAIDGVVTPPPPTTFAASGRVTDSAGAGMTGVSLAFSLVSGTGSVPAAVSTNASGDWTASGFVAGSTYRATPSKSGSTFSPASSDFSAAATSLNFAAAAPPPPAGNGSIIPLIDASMKARLQGILNSSTRNPAAFAKIGDSITESGSFLVDIGCNAYDLGAYTNLEPTIQNFRETTFTALSPTWCGGNGNSFNRASTSAEAGWTTGTALAIGACGESFFRCEIKATNAGYAYIMYGTNDLERSDTTTFRSNLSRIVSETISLGTVPILSTIPPRLDSSAMGALVAGYNQAVQEVGATYQIPVVNYWQALQNIGAADHYGMDGDGVHPEAYQGGNASIFTAAGLKSGYNVRNLTFLQIMEKMKRIVTDNGSADANP